MNICMYVCVCVYVCMYVCMHVRMYMYVLCMCVCMSLRKPSRCVTYQINYTYFRPTQHRFIFIAPYVYATCFDSFSGHY